MDGPDNAYHVRIDHHTATPAALADAQHALLRRRSIDPRQVAARAWKRRGVVVLGLVAVVGLVLLLVAVPAVGRASAYDNCVAHAQERDARLSAAGIDGDPGAESASVEELCARYRG